MNPRTRSTAKAVTQKALLCLLGIGAALLLGECAVRILGLDPEVVYVEKGRYRLSSNPRIGYEPVPGLDYRGKSLHFYDYRGQSNSLGYRDHEHSVDKPAGAYRILVLGDSVAAGHQIADAEDAFPAVLEASLRAAGVPAEVLNFGVSGYNTQQEVETLKDRGLRFDPDLVLLAYCLNDRERNDGGILRTLVNESEGKVQRGPPRGWLLHSALARVVWYRVLERHKERPRAYAELEEDTVARYFAELEELARAHGFEVLVVVFPDLSDLADYAFAAQHEFVHELGRAHRFELFDLLEPFRQAGAVKGDRYHPNGKGHRRAGEAIARFVLERRAADRSRGEGQP